MMNRILLVITAVALERVVLEAAEPPAVVNYQGVLRNASDQPQSGSYDMIFRFYSDAFPGGVEILRDAHTAAVGAAVTVTGGLFNVRLGTGSVADGSGPGTYGTLAEVFRDYTDVYLSIQVGAEILSPRIRVASAGYALNADHLDGKNSGEFAQLASANTFAAGTQTVQTGAAATKGLVIQGSAGQSANLQEWQNSGGSAVASVSAGGVLSGDGAGLTSLNAGNLSSGIVPDGRVAGTYSSAVTFSNPGNSFTGNGSGLTNVNAQNADTLDTLDSTAFGRLAAANTFTTGTQTVQTGAAATKGLVIQGAASQSANLQEWQDTAASVVASVSASGVFSGDGSGLTSLDASDLASGTVPNARLSGTYSSALTLSNAANSLSGDGSALTGVNAATLDGLDSTAFSLAGHTHATLTAGTGLAGGSYNGGGIATFSVAYGTASGTAVQGNQAATITAGNGLTGGVSADPLGDGFSATLNVGAGIGISVAADSISVLYGTAAGTAVQGSETATITAGNGLTGGISADALGNGFNAALAVGGGNGIAVAADSVGLGPLTADWNQTGAFDIVLANIFSDLKMLENVGSAFYGTLDVGDLSADTTFTFSGAGGTVWTSGNDGAATGLDADLLDTISSGSFLRSDTSDNYTSGTLTLDAPTTFNVNGTFNVGFDSSLDDDTITFDAGFESLTWSNAGFKFLLSADLEFESTLDTPRTISNAYDIRISKDIDNDNVDAWFQVYTDNTTIEQMRIQDGDEAATLFDGVATANGIDYAEAFRVSDENLEPGDLVALDLERPGYCVRSSGAYEQGLLGVVSGKPGFLTGMSFDAEDQADPELRRQRDEARARKESAEERRLTIELGKIAERSHRPIALLGRVPVKVDGAHGAIRPGDRLTSSSTPGHAMAMTGPGPSVGVALEGWDVKDTGKILAFIQPGWVGPDAFESGKMMSGRTEPAAASRSPSRPGQSANDAIGPSPIEAEENLRAKESLHAPLTGLAEYFPVREPVSVGDVLVADREVPGAARLGRAASDPAVIGIVSGPAGLVLGSEAGAGGEDATLAAFPRSRAPVALTGTARCKVDAGYGAIRVGDLLMVSPTPGHAMRADNPLPGTILGKALEPLDSGTGSIEVLVMLR